MIDPKTFQKEWFEGLRKKYKSINPPVAEKMIHSLALVEELSKTNLDFVLKGGTSLAMLISPFRRFSVDVDIVTKVNREKVEEILQKICEGNHFTTYKLEEKRSYKPGIPKAHYKLFYNSSISNRENRLLLDILFSEIAYPKILSKQIKNEWIITIEPEVKVSILSIESVLGDKLTAFAPNTTGILYGKRKELEIAKQLFDIGCLFDAAENVNEIKTSFQTIVSKEIKYRGLLINGNDVLNDIIQTAILIATRGSKLSKQDMEHFREIVNGVSSLNEFLIGEKFRIEDAITAASKAAYLAAKILTKDSSPLLKFSSQLKLEDYMITHQSYSFLNKLRKIPGGSLYYWHQTIELIKD